MFQRKTDEIRAISSQGKKQKKAKGKQNTILREHSMPFLGRKKSRGRATPSEEGGSPEGRNRKGSKIKPADWASVRGKTCRNL